MRNKQSFVIVGFMGSGKTVLLKHLSSTKRLEGFEFVDLDNFIEVKENKTVRDIVEAQGVDQFRLLEYKYLESVFINGPSIVSLGGGALHQGSLTYLRSMNVKIIWINTPYSRCLERIRLAGDVRPLNKLSDDKLRELYNKRLEFYKQADFVTTELTEKLIRYVTSSTI
jgi:shikimate kinase